MSTPETGGAKSALHLGDADSKAQENKASLDWLRAHGVTVETPEDRKQIQKASQQLQALKIGDAGTRTFSYVLIPAGLTDQIVERTGVVYSDERGHSDQLPAILAPSFAAGIVPQSVAIQMCSSVQLTAVCISVIVTFCTHLARYGGNSRFAKLQHVNGRWE